MPDQAADSEPAVEAEPASASAAAVTSLEGASPDSAGVALGQLLSGAGRTPGRLAVPPPASRGGRDRTASRALLLQRTVGNAATARMLMRQGVQTPPKPKPTAKPPTPKPSSPSAVLPPPELTAYELAYWVADQVHPKHRDVIVVVDHLARKVTLFDDAAEPKAKWVFEKPQKDIPGEGLWRFTASGAIDQRLFDDGLWHTGYIGDKLETVLLANRLQDEINPGQWPTLKASLPEDPNVIYAVYPLSYVVEEVVVTAPRRKKREEKWGEHDVERARAMITAARKGADPSKPHPTALWAWQRKKDGTWWVNVWVGGDHEELQLHPDESTKDLVKRINDATAVVKARDNPALSTRVQGTKPGPPQFEGGRKKGEFTGHVPGRIQKGPGIGQSPYNAPAFPAKIISHGSEGSQGREGAEITVNGASVNFTMYLDYQAVSDSWFAAFLASWGTIEYTWDIFDVSKVKLGTLKDALGKPTDQITLEAKQASEKVAANPDDEAAKAELEKLQKELAKRGKDPDSGRVGDIAREWANTWEDTQADLTSVPMFIPGVNIAWTALIAVSDVVQLVGAPIKSLFGALAAPAADKSIRFPSEGTFLLRCTADPVITQDQIERIKAKGMEPIIRPPSVAYIAVRVTPINQRASEVNDAELTAIANLQTVVNSMDADDPDRPDYEASLKEAREAVGDNNIAAIKRAIEHAKKERDNITAWKEEHQKLVQADRPDSELADRRPDLVKWKARLDMHGVSLDEWMKVQDQVIDELEKKTLPRVNTFGLDGCDRGTDDKKIFRPRMTLVSEVDGHVYPLVANLVQENASAPGDRRWRLIDVTSEDTKRVYPGTGATHNAAINDAFTQFKEKCAYGRGTIAIRLPDALKTLDGETISVEAQMRAQPGMAGRFEERLSNLATAAEVASLFVSGPIGAGIGIVGGVISAGLAIKNFVTRVQEGKPVLSFETAMDALAVVGAFMMAGQAARKSARLAGLMSRAKPVGDALHVITTAGQVLVIPGSLMLELSQINDEEREALKTNPHADRGKYSARRMMAWARAVKSGIVMVRMTQMASDPEAGWDPLKKPGATKEVKPADAPRDEPPPAKPGTGKGTSTNDQPPATGADHPPAPGTSHAPPATITPAPVPHDPFHAAQQKGTVTPGTGDAVVKAAGDWKLRLRAMVDGFEPANRQAAAQELADTRRQALDHEYAKADATHGCVPFDVGTVGFDSDIDATMIPKERLADHSGPSRPISEQINAAADAAQQVVNGLRQRFGGDPDTVLDVAIHAYVGEDIEPQYKTPEEAAAARAHDTAVSFAEMRRGMTRDEWLKLREEYQQKLGGKDAHPLERKMLEDIEEQMIEGFDFKGRMDKLMEETMAKVVADAKGPIAGEQASALARDRILLQKRRDLAKAFKDYPNVDWVKIKQLQSEIRWFAPGAYATEAAFKYAVKYGQVRKEAGKAAAKAAGGGPPTREQVLAELNPNLDEEKWVSPADRAARLAAVADANIGELGRHPHGAEPKAQAKDAAKYAGRVLEAAEAMGGPVRHGPMEDALRLFKQSKWPDGTPELRDRAVARWADQALDGNGVTHNPDGTVTITPETYDKFTEAAKKWMRDASIEARITERAMADRTDAPDRPSPKPPAPPAPPPTTPAVDAIGLSEAAKSRVLAAMSPDTAVAVAGWLGKERLESISASPERLQELLEAHQRVLPALTDPLALAGLRRLTEKNPKLPGAQAALKDASVLDVIMDANPDNLALALRVFGRPDMQSPGLHPQRSKSALPDLSRDITRLTAIDRFGADAYDELARNRAVRIALEEKVEGLGDADARAAAIEQILNAESTGERRRILELPGPRRRSRSLDVKPDKSDPAAWKEYEEDARKFIENEERAGKTNPLTNKPYSEMSEAELARFVEARATLLQTKEKYVSRYKEFQKLTQAQKEQILDQMDALAETHGVLPQWNPRARVAEALYLPGGGLNQKTFPNKVFPAPGGQAGGTRLDGVFGAGERTGSGTQKEWIEFKSNKAENLTASLAAAHAKEGWQDWHALLWDPAKQNDGLVMWYARVPSPAVKQRMTEILLGSKSPFRAVRFGDGPWVERAATTPMPAAEKLPPWWTGPPPGGPDKP